LGSTAGEFLSGVGRLIHPLKRRAGLLFGARTLIWRHFSAELNRFLVDIVKHDALHLRKFYDDYVFVMPIRVTSFASAELRKI